MKRKRCKWLFALVAAVLCMAAFSVAAFASDDDWCEYGDSGTPDTEASEPADTTESGTTEESSTPEPDISGLLDGLDLSGIFNAVLSGSGSPLTPTGNLTLIDDILQTDGTESDDEEAKREEKQFITVQSKNGSYFYIVIDRSGDNENVYFLNQVDEADLLALIEDEETEEAPAVCTCTDKCMVGDINLSCTICQTTMSECAGREPEPEPTEEPDTEPEEPETESGGGSAVLLIVLVLAMAGGGAVYYFKFRKPKPDTKGPVDLDDYDFGDEDEDEDGDYEFEKDEDEQEERNEGD